MSTTAPAPDDLELLEDAASVDPARDAGTDVDGDEGARDAGEELSVAPLRIDLVVSCGVVAAGLMIGGVFEGANGRILAVLTGLMGVAVASLAARRTRPLAVNAIILGGLVLAGLLAVVPAGIDNLFRIPALLSESRELASQLRPPAELLPGWRLLLGWLMAIIGFVSGWIGREFRAPALGLLAPMPLLAWGAVSVPEEAKLPTGIAAVVLFVVGLGILSSAQDQAAAGDDGAPGLAFELRRAVRAVPLLLVLVAALIGMSRTNLLFPDPVYDPTRDAQRPKAVPLSEVEDRVLFTVESRIAGPWRLGILDVYDGQDWRLPAFAESDFSAVPEDGVVDRRFEAGVRADFTVQGLAGSVLPGLQRTVGVVARGPRLTWDPRTQTIRTAQGSIPEGMQYSVVGARLPTETELGEVAWELPPDLERFTQMPDPPAEVRALLADAPEDRWQRLEELRRRILEEVIVTGAGTPVSVPPERVVDMLVGSGEGSPYEVVAAQAMLARWAGIPARIGYGFDGGAPADGAEPVPGQPVLRELRPKHGASWLEVWFPEHGWFPVIGTPLNVRTSLSTENPTVAADGASADADIGVQVFIPLRRAEEVALYRQVQRLVLLALPFLALAILLWFSVPVARKWWRRSRRRAAAERAGVSAQVAQAYAEFRDLCTDLGVPGDADTPLAFVDRFVDDEEHVELAWLVTRVLWGDLRHVAEPVHAVDAMELSRSLRKRASQGQPTSIRVIALVSRRSLQDPFDPTLVPPNRKERREAAQLVGV